MPIENPDRQFPRFACLRALVFSIALCAAPPASRASAGWFSDLFKEFDAEDFHDDMSRRVLDNANRIDNLFGEDRIDEEAQQSRIRAYTDIEWDEEDGSDFGLKLKLHLVLPNTKERLRLDLNGSDEQQELDDEEENRLAAGEERERTIGLNLKASKTARTETDLGLGLRYRDSSLVLYEKARHRVYFTGENWLPRLTNEIRHYGDTGWEYRGQLDFDRVLSDTWFMRTRTEARWYENKDVDEDEQRCNDGYCFNQHFFLYQRFDNPNHAIAYDWLNYFVTEPDNQLDEAQLRVRYRHRLYWDWMHFEVRPRVRFREEEDYDARWSVLLRIEGIFGYYPGDQVGFREVDSIIQNDEEQSVPSD